ncbi:MAG: peptidoglycan DD-metalloendopeptidase family protein [Oceanococcus sp.]
MDHARRLVVGFFTLSLSLILLSACSGNWVRWEERQFNYTVKSGESLHQIAFKHQLDYRDLAWWNGVGRNDHIYPGQVLRLDPPLPGELRTPQRPQQSQTSGRTRSSTKPSATAAPQRTVRRPADKPAAGPRRWQWPARGSILARFDPSQGRKGLDIGGRPGDPISAAADGKVVYAGNALKGYGQLVIIKHGEDYLTAYGHNDKLLVAEGDAVKAGSPIATMGLGPQNKPLLHFEIRRMGKPINPEPLLP